MPNDAIDPEVLTGDQPDVPASDTKQAKPNFLASLPPGSLIGTPWSKAPALKLQAAQINAVRDLLNKQMTKDMASRREEILRVWEAELFWRGYQHLLLRLQGFGWELAGAGSGYGNGEVHARSIFETNLYRAYGQSVVNALTRKVPTVRFEPNCPQSDADITAADQANKLVDMIKRSNKLLKLMSELAVFLYTDGRASIYTRYERDGQLFGFKKAEDAAEHEGLNVEEASAEAAQSATTPGAEGAEDTEGIEVLEDNSKPATPKKPWPQPKGQQVISIHGALEVKYPIKANSQSEAGWLLWSLERDVSIAKGMYPKQAGKIHISRGGPAGDDIDRMARVNVKLGVEDNYVTSDSEAYDVTIQNAWLRDCTLLEIKDDQIRDELLEMSQGVGLRFTFCGEDFIEAKQESMDDHWTLVFADPFPGGAHRPGLGTDYIPIQRQLNNFMELRSDYLINGIPMKYMDSETFDVERIKDQTNTPGGIRPFVATPGVPVEQLVFVEPVIQFPLGLNEAIEDLGKGQLAQILTGVFPALSGDDTGNNDTGIGMRMQRDNALGRIGIPWRNIKEGVASVMMQAVQCLAKNHDEDIVMPGLEKGADPIIVELQDLKAGYHCSPDTDENYPESWTDVQQRVTDLLDPNKTSPEVMAEFDSPQNYKLLKRAIGLTDFYMAKEAAYEKQLGEIEDMKKSGPLPNPEYQEMEEKIQSMAQSMPPELAADPQAQQMTQQAQQKLQGMSQEISSVPIDPVVDDNKIHADTCLLWLNGPVGRAFKAGTTEQQQAYANIRLHFTEHDKVAQENAAKNKNVPEKGISKSISVDALVKLGVPLEKAVDLIKNL